MKDILKIIAIVLITALLITISVVLLACAIYFPLKIASYSQNETMLESDAVIQCVNEKGIAEENDDRIIYDKSTKVMYISRGAGCAYTPMYNADGTLRIWDGE